MPAQPPGPPLGQHTVSRFLLKRFADGTGRVAMFDRHGGRCRHVSFGSRMFESTFDAHDPERSEALWGDVETQAGNVLARLGDNSSLSRVDLDALREFMAVHWARSRAIMAARDTITEVVVEDSKRKILESRPHMLVEAYLAEVGALPTGSDQLEWVNELVHARVLDANRDKWHSERNEVNLSQAREIFMKSDVQLGLVPKGSELVIGDAPVVVMKPGDPGVGPHHGVALGDASQIAMPISPDILLALGPSASIVEMTPDVVSWYNHRQWDGYQDWIVARPPGPEESRMRLEQELERLRRTGSLPR